MKKPHKSKYYTQILNPTTPPNKYWKRQTKGYLISATIIIKQSILVGTSFHNMIPFFHNQFTLKEAQVEIYLKRDIRVAENERKNYKYALQGKRLVERRYFY